MKVVIIKIVYCTLIIVGVQCVASAVFWQTTRRFVARMGRAQTSLLTRFGVAEDDAQQATNKQVRFYDKLWVRVVLLISGVVECALGVLGLLGYLY